MIGVWGGCAGRSVHTDRAQLSSALEKSAQQTIRPDGTVVTNQLPPDVTPDDGLSEDEAVAMALWNNAGFQENLSKLGLARGDLAQAGLLANPTFSMLFPLGPKQLEFTATFPLEALWLRPRRVAIAQVEAERVARGLMQNGLDLIRDVRVGWIDLNLAREKERLSADAVKIRERIAEIASARQRAGEGTELETAATDAEVVVAREDRRRLQHDVVLMRERLWLLIGWNQAGTNVDFTSGDPVPETDFNIAELERQALAARPDLRASELAMEAAGKRAGLARAEIFALSGIIDANGSGSQGFEIGPGMALPIPVLNQNQAGRARAHAELERAAWNYAGTRQRVGVEVRSAYVRLQQAREDVEAYEKELLPALEGLERGSQRAFELGEVSPLVVQENSRQLLVARVRHADSAAALRRAWAELERSAGARLGASKSNGKQPTR